MIDACVVRDSSANHLGIPCVDMAIEMNNADRAPTLVD